MFISISAAYQALFSKVDGDFIFCLGGGGGRGVVLNIILIVSAFIKRILMIRSFLCNFRSTRDFFYLVARWGGGDCQGGKIILKGSASFHVKHAC